MCQPPIELASLRPHHPEPLVPAPEVEEVLQLGSLLLLHTGVLGSVIQHPGQRVQPQPVLLVVAGLPCGLQFHPAMDNGAEVSIMLLRTTKYFSCQINILHS